MKAELFVLTVPIPTYVSRQFWLEVSEWSAVSSDNLSSI